VLSITKPPPYGSTTDAGASRCTNVNATSTPANVNTATIASELKYFKNPISVENVVKNRAP
jgi:hypothetical protein